MKFKMICMTAMLLGATSVKALPDTMSPIAMVLMATSDQEQPEKATSSARQMTTTPAQVQAEKLSLPVQQTTEQTQAAKDTPPAALLLAASTQARKVTPSTRPIATPSTQVQPGKISPSTKPLTTTPVQGQPEKTPPELPTSPASPTTRLLMEPPAEAQPSWSFDKIMQAAMSSHPLVLGKRSAQVAAQADREGAEWQRYPTPSVEASTYTSGTRTLRIDQPLWTGGRITAGIDAAASRFDAAGAALEETRQQLSFKVIAATTEALRQQSRQQHNIAGVKEHEELLARIQRRVMSEVSPMADQHLAATRLYTAANDVSATAQALNNALTQLSQLTGQPVGAVSEQGLNEAGTPATLNEALTKALAYSPTIRRLAFEEQTAIANIATKRSAYMPQLVFRLESSSVNQTWLTGNQTHVWQNRAMLVLTAQPGAGLSAKSNEESAVAQRDGARLAREAAERDIRDSITQDWNEWEAARIRLKNANQARVMAAEVSDSYARQYAAGHKTWIDVVNAVRENTQAELAVDDARAQMLTASLRLREQTGLLSRYSGADRLYGSYSPVPDGAVRRTD